MLPSRSMLGWNTCSVNRGMRKVQRHLLMEPQFPPCVKIILDGVLQKVARGACTGALPLTLYYCITF